jgi:glyoxylase-like metal-dependent hydrolase (beta-lactamase superfamily II)
MSTPDLHPLNNRVHYLTGSVNAAIIATPEHKAIVVDTGGDKDYGRRIKKACDTLGLEPAAIINTHAHADHYGGNEYLTRMLDIPVYAPPFEASIMQSPYLEPVYLFGGAKPPPEMMNKWLLAKASPVHHTLQPGTLELHGVTLEIVPCSGHAHTHYAVKVADVLLAADAVFGMSVLERYPLPFGQDIGSQMTSARTMQTLGARVVLPGHGDPTEQIPELVRTNLQAFERAAATVAGACTGVDTATVLKNTCTAFGVHMTDLPRYYLNLCTVMAYLTYLRDEGRVGLELRGNTVVWHQV